MLFDMDGLLLDTENFYTEVQTKILARYGKEFSWALKAKMMGKKALEAGQVFIAETGLQGILTAEDFIKEREKMLHDLFPKCQLMPGAERLIRHLHNHGVPMAVATSSHRTHFDMKTQKYLDLFGLMHHIVVGDDPMVTRGKPSPDIFQVAAQRFGESNFEPGKFLVFEDAPTGVQAAKNASMPVVMVPHPELDKSLIDGDQVLSSLLDFDPSFWGLPAFD